MEPLPETTAARTALWRALHVAVDPPPHVLVDEVGVKLLAPGNEWRQREDMDPRFTKPFRASIVARARFVEDLVEEAARENITQYVILGAGLDSLAQRRPDLLERITVFEVDQPGPQAWKRQRLEELGLVHPALRFVPVNFEAGENLMKQLHRAGFDAARPAVFASTGVSMYLTKDATAATMRIIAKSAPGSVLAMTFLLPLDPVDTCAREGVAKSAEGAKAGGTPFISFYSPEEIKGMARRAGFSRADHVDGEQLATRYFAGRRDGLRPPANAENFLVARM